MADQLMRKKIKIVHIINNLQIGGAEKMLVLLLNELSKRDDIELHVVSLEGGGVLKKDLSDQIHVKEFQYKLFTPRFISKLKPSFRFGLLFYILSVKPDIIHGHLIKGENFARVLGFVTKIPVVTTSHDTLINPSIGARLLNRYIRKAVAVSQVVADHLKSAYGFDKKKITIIPNAIDTKLFDKSIKRFNIDRPVFIYIGRLLESKGIEHAIIGLSRLINEYPNMEFLIYGQAVFEPYKNYLDKFVCDNGWNFVRFMGRTDNVPDALKTGDIFVSPSQSEGFGISVLEAAAAGKPIIATGTGAVNLIVKNKKSGILVDWGDPDGIYRAAKKMLDDKLVEKYGSESSKIAHSQFGVREVGQMYYDLYKQITG